MNPMGETKRQFEAVVLHARKSHWKFQSLDCSPLDANLVVRARPGRDSCLPGQHPLSQRRSADTDDAFQDYLLGTVAVEFATLVSFRLHSGSSMRHVTFAVWLLLIPSMLQAEVVVTPRKVELADAYARRQLLMSVDGIDVTRKATWTSLDSETVSVDATGYATPHADGSATIMVTWQGHEARVPVTVLGLKDRRPVDFSTEIVPLLSRYGCNSGGCHGKASGQNGFKLSLFGFDREFDYQAITQEARGRRVFAVSARTSLLVQKAIGTVPHGGGKRFDADSEVHRLFTSWIEAGAPPSAPNAALVTALEMSPAEASFIPGQQQQVSVVAVYSDDSRRDVTRQADFATNIEVVAHVDRDGLITAGEQTGEATIMARFMGQVAIFRAIRPHAAPLNELPDFTPAGRIDELAAARWMKLGLQPSPVSDDATFIRRVTLDIAGRLPAVDETRAFLADKSPEKRNALIDRLLDSPDYAAFFALRWGTILRNSRLAGSEDAAYAFHNWLKDRIARNVPYDEFVRGIVAAAGEWPDAPAINWFWQSRDDQLHQVTADTAQVFLGLRLQCARCHHHPYERWGQEDYYGLAGFFTRLGRKSFGQPPPYFASSKVTTGERNPLTGKVPEPKYLDGEPAVFSPDEDPRHGLVDWMAKPENPFFARTLVNRLWGHFLGRGLVDEVDDMRATNPASNSALLDWMARDFVEHGFDQRHVVRQIVQSKVYQLASEPTEHNADDRQNFARFYGRRLYAEVFLDALDQATGSKTRFSGMSGAARAVDLPHEGFGSYFLDTFDRPQRVSGCECERSSAATLAQVLLLSNSDEIENKINDGNGRVARHVKEQTALPEIIEELYLASLSRRPHADELRRIEVYLESEADRQLALQDVLWVLINSKEFAFNH